ncbi:MAG TPA: SUMF1/EgtB/PvdO family nonheme iron enzyme, partial [Candidatus Acidoferrales bacterium]
MLLDGLGDVDLLPGKIGEFATAQYGPNAYGLFNMCDNVHEWCADWYDARYYESAAARNPQG